MILTGSAAPASFIRFPLLSSNLQVHRIPQANPSQVEVKRASYLILKSVDWSIHPAQRAKNMNTRMARTSKATRSLLTPLRTLIVFGSTVVNGDDSKGRGDKIRRLVR